MDGYKTAQIRRAIVMASFALAEETLVTPGGKIPYISDPLGEALIMCLKRAPEKLIIAAILKDAFKLGLISSSKIEKAFGSLLLQIIDRDLEKHDPFNLAFPWCELQENVYGYNLSRIKHVIYRASLAHAGQWRKEARNPFISHPLAVGINLSLLRVPQEGIEGGLLHDAPEDTDYSIKAILADFGAKVAEIAECCTEPDKNLPWDVRKQHTIDKARQANLLKKLVFAADKLNNLQSIDDQLLAEQLKSSAEIKRAKVWGSFNAGYDSQRWYYQEITRAIIDNVAYNDLQPIFGTLMRLVEKVFGQTVIKDKYTRALISSR